nr:PHD finger protein ALFIN-LIKE 2-like [Ipomoea batatas]
MASVSPSAAQKPRSVEDIFKDFSGRRSAVLDALGRDVEEFFSLCDPDKDNLCLYGLPDGTWEVALPAEEVPPEMPEPVLGINFARDGMRRGDWVALVAMHTDSWLLSVAFYFGARLNQLERERLFRLINDQPTVHEVVTGKRLSKDKPSADSGPKSKPSTKNSKPKGNPTRKESYEHDDDENEDEDEDEGGDDESNAICGSCGENYDEKGFWIGCDICERWFHGKCVKITPAKAESIKKYKCPFCSKKRGRE